MERTPPFSAEAKRNAVLASLFAIPPIVFVMLLASGNLSVRVGSLEFGAQPQVQQLAD